MPDESAEGDDSRPAESPPGTTHANHEGEDLFEAIPGIISVLTLGLGVTAAVLGFGQFTVAIFIVGWLLLTPLSAILADTWQVRSWFSGSATTEQAARDAATVGDEEAALEALKRRYARGEIDEAEFERRTALLIENETIEGVAERVDRRHEESRATSTDSRDVADAARSSSGSDGVPDRSGGGASESKHDESAGGTTESQHDESASSDREPEYET